MDTDTTPTATLAELMAPEVDSLELTAPIAAEASEQIPGSITVTVNGQTVTLDQYDAEKFAQALDQARIAALAHLTN